MKKRTIITAILFAGACLSGAFAQTVEEKADQLMNAYTKQGRFSGSVLIAKAGKTLLNKGYGMANYEFDVPNTAQTKFRIASVTKQFTAMAIMQLQERKLLNVNDVFAKYLPDYPKAIAEKVTIHQLLSHTGGIYDPVDLPEFEKRLRTKVSISEFITSFQDKPLDFEPGTKFQYSNTGYILLTAIIEKVSGKTYEQFLHENIFELLKMQNTGYDKTEVILKNRAAGYNTEGKELRNADYIDMSIPSGAGALYSTVEDLYLWDRALYTEKLVIKSTIEQIFTPVKSEYGYGWIIDEVFGHKRTWHNGGINGFGTNISRLVNDDLCIVILGNRYPNSADAIAKDLAAIVLNQPYQMPMERNEIVAVSMQILDTYLGEYKLSPTTTFTISREGEKLMLQRTGQPKFELFPESETKFFLKVVDAKIEFIKDDNGKVNSLKIEMSGNTRVASKNK